MSAKITNAPTVPSNFRFRNDTSSLGIKKFLVLHSRRLRSYNSFDAPSSMAEHSLMARCGLIGSNVINGRAITRFVTEGIPLSALQEDCVCNEILVVDCLGQRLLLILYEVFPKVTDCLARLLEWKLKILNFSHLKKLQVVFVNGDIFNRHTKHESAFSMHTTFCITSVLEYKSNLLFISTMSLACY